MSLATFGARRFILHGFEWLHSGSFFFSIWYTASEQTGKVKIGSGIQRQEFVDGYLERTYTLRYFHKFLSRFLLIKVYIDESCSECLSPELLFLPRSSRPPSAFLPKRPAPDDHHTCTAKCLLKPMHFSDRRDEHAF